MKVHADSSGGYCEYKGEAGRSGRHAIAQVSSAAAFLEVFLVNIRTWSRVAFSRSSEVIDRFCTI